jgi:hypothetical protein
MGVYRVVLIGTHWYPSRWQASTIRARMLTELPRSSRTVGPLKMGVY